MKAAPHVSRLADDLEATQLATGTDVLDLARTVLDDPASCRRNRWTSA